MRAARSDNPMQLLSDSDVNCRDPSEKPGHIEGPEFGALALGCKRVVIERRQEA
ncbi:hypothetical protein D3C83_186380 [compost metagenome]